jgi:hypothetical protein
LIAALMLLSVLTLSGLTMSASAGAREEVGVPVPREVHSRSKPLRMARTSIIPFASAPFPYLGKQPGSDHPFLNVEVNGRRGHKTPYGRLYWADETYNDNRVLLHIPQGFDVRRPSVMIVFLHGHGATIERDVLERQQVAAQISAAGVNAVLVAPQLAVDAADSAAGKFWEPGGFTRFVGEASKQLTVLHGDPRSVRTFAAMPVVIVAYSGGYLPAAACVSKGGLGKRLRGVVLLDALYGEIKTFANWIVSEPGAFFVSTYLRSTQEKNSELARILAERHVAFDTALQSRLGRGSVAILPGGTDVSHRDLVTQAWSTNPVTDLFHRLKEYQR